MKVVKGILIVVVLLVVAFFAIGFLSPDFTYENRVTVNAPVEKTFAVFKDPANMDKWIDGFKNIRNLEGGPYEVGSKWRLEFEQEGQTIVLTETITAFEENELVAMILESEVMTMDARIEFSGEGGTTKITATNHVKPKGIVMQSLLRLFKGGFESQGQEQYEKLADLVESTAAG